VDLDSQRRVGARRGLKVEVPGKTGIGHGQEEARSKKHGCCRFSKELLLLVLPLLEPRSDGRWI
jgi:hypothetical protein